MNKMLQGAFPSFLQPQALNSHFLGHVDMLDTTILKYHFDITFIKFILGSRTSSPPITIVTYLILNSPVR